MKPSPRPPKPKIRWLSYIMIIGVLLIMAGPFGLLASIIICTGAEVVS